MSTSYYRFKKPVTCARIVTEGSHDKVTIWTGHGNSGTLVVNKGEGVDILSMLVDQSEQVLHVWAGGIDVGILAKKYDKNLSDDEHVVSDTFGVYVVEDILMGKKLVD